MQKRLPLIFLALLSSGFVNGMFKRAPFLVKPVTAQPCRQFSSEFKEGAKLLSAQNKMALVAAGVVAWYGSEYINAVVDVNTKNICGQTQLHYEWSTSVVALLIKVGADISAKDKCGQTPLHNVRNAKIVALLINAGADVKAKDNGGRTPLHNTCCSAKIVDLLIEAGADVNAKDNGGRTPLHNIHNTKAVVALLIRAGADVNDKDNSGSSILDTAKEYNPEVVDTLIDAGAKTSYELDGLENKGTGC
jgi:hypothetical protein